MTGSGLVARGPVKLLGCTAASNFLDDFLDIRDGDNVNAPVRIFLQLATTRTLTWEPPEPMRFPRGIFSAFGSNVIRATFFIEPLTPDEAEQPAAPEPQFPRRTPPLPS
jgi:hypothetical protein